MRLATYALAIVVALAAMPGHAAPPKATIKPDRGEIEKLDKQLTELQVKQAYVAAIKVARKLYDLQVKTTGKDSLEAERRKQALAGMVNAAGDYAESAKLYKELLADAERKHGSESREALYALMPLAGPYWAQNRLDDLEPIYVRQLQITKKLDGEQSQAYAQALETYGTLLNSRNEYSSAQRIYEQSLKITEALTPNKNDMTLIGPVQMLAMAYWQTNQKPKAIQLYDRVIKIAESAPNTTVLQVASTIWGIASQYHYGGRDDLATPLIKRVTDMYTREIARLEKASPSNDDYQIAIMLGMLGYTYRQSNDLANAEKALLKAIALDEKKNGYSSWTGSLAEIERAQGKPKDALALYEKAQAAIAKLAPQSATIYNVQIADVLRELGDYKRAETLLVAYRANIEKTYGKKHPIYGMAEMQMSFLYMASGKIADAEKLLRDSLEIAERELQNVLKTGTENDHAVYFGRNTYRLDTAIDFQLKYAPTSGSAAKLALTTLLRRKGRVLDAAAASLATIRRKLSPDDKKLLDELASARAKLAKLTVAGPTATGDAGEYAKEVATLEEQIQKLELAIGKKSAQYRAVNQQIELAAVQKMIPKDARLVEIVNFQPGTNAVYAINPVLPPRHYAAYVVAASGDPKVVDLGEAAPIDQAVEKFRKAVADPDNANATDLGKALNDLTFAKVVPLLGGSTNVLIAPDGALNVVPFSALVDSRKQFLIKTYTFTYLTSGRDLLRLSAKTKAQGGGVIFADPSFDATNAPKATGGTTRGMRSADLASLSWPPLPGTGAEAEAVVQMMKGLTLYRGDKATETALKGVHGPKVLHLATHGFFLADEPPPAAASDQGAPGAPAPAPPQAAAPAAPGPPGAPTGPDAYENPLLRSGLALAGANKLTSGDEDGILTALEASGLDLTGTKLVVLSACETGVGKVTNGEGVYGLRRALVIAGAESLVMTLWQVDDFATKELMSGYYKRLGTGKRRSSALRDVQLEIMSRDKYQHPFYWASFLPAGLNSPLKD